MPRASSGKGNLDHRMFRMDNGKHEGGITL